MKSFLLFVGMLLFMLVNVATSQETAVNIPDDFYKHFKGKSIEIDAKTNKKIELEVFCNMRRQGNKITGSYYNLEDENFYYLEGIFRNNTQFFLEQYSKNFDIVGTFEGTFRTSTLAKGVWKSSNGSRSFVFDFEEDYSNNVQFKNYTDTTTYYIQDDKQNPYCVLNFDYLHPVKHPIQTSVGLVNGEIQKRFFGGHNVGGTVDQSIAKKKNDLFSDYRNIVEKQFIAAKSKRKVTNEMKAIFNRRSKFTTGVYFNEDNILCLSKDSIEEAGGEVMNEGKSYYVFNMKTGLPVNIDEIFFYPKYKDLLTNMFIEKIKAWLNIKTMKQLEEDGFDKDFIKYNRNFYVDRCGLGFYFNPWEINERSVNVYFTWYELAPYLKEKSVVSHLFPRNLKLDANRVLSQQDMVPVKPVVVDEDGEIEEEEDEFLPGIFIPGESDANLEDDDEEGGVIFPEDQ